MTSNVPVVFEDKTIGEIENLVVRNTKDWDTINYIYIVDAQKRLTSVISLKEVFCLDKTRRAKEFQPEKLITVRAHTDQERVVLVALKHKLKAIPVVDKNGTFLGVVPPDTILSILHAENIEDVLHFAGSRKLDNPAVDLIQAGALLHLRKRLPWLILGLVGGIVAAVIVGFFEGALQEQIVLAAFIPAIVYMADAVGSQTQLIFIRSLALESKLDLKKYIWRELTINILLATILGLMTSMFVFAWFQVPALSLTLGVSMVITVLAAMAVALTLPLLLQKIKIDPAIASGPFATVIRDVMSILIYFGVASLFL